MEIVSANFTADGNINVVIEDMPEGTSITVPDDVANADRIAVAEWEAEGNTITPYQAVAPVDRSNYDAMLDRRMNTALDAGDTDAAFQILLQKQE